MLAGLAPLRASAGAAGCWVQCCPSQSSGPPWPCLVYDVFLVAVLRILGVRSTPSSPSFIGACGAGNVPPALLRR
jgi:hypothetical protein